MNYFTKGNAVHAFFTNGAAQMVVASVAGATNYVAIAGSVGGNPAISQSGGLAIRFPGSAIEVIGAGRPWSGSVTESKSYLYNVALGICNFTATPNNRIHEWYKDATALYGLWISDNGGAALEWLRATGGQAAGLTSVILTSPTIFLTTTTGGVQITSSATSNGALVVTDTGAAGANIKLVGNNGAAVKPKKFLRSCADDFQIISDAYSQALLTVGEQITFGQHITGFNGLELARDTGTTLTAAGIPIGSIGIYLCAGTAGWSALSMGASKTATGTDSLHATTAGGAGTGAAITSGTWRILGCISGSVGPGFLNLLMRLA